MMFAANTAPLAPPALVRVADAPAEAKVDFVNEPLFLDIVRRADLLRGTVEVYRGSLADGDGDELPAWGLFKSEVKDLAALDFKAHQSLEQRGLDGDLKCILRGISADLTLRMGDLDLAADIKTKDKALKELSYLLRDNVEVIKTPPTVHSGVPAA